MPWHLTEGGFLRPWPVQGKPPAGSEELMAITMPYYGFAIDTFGADRCMVSAAPLQSTPCACAAAWRAPAVIK